MSAIVRTLIGMYAELQERTKVDGLLDQKVDLELAVAALAQDRTLTDMERQVLAIAGSGCSNNKGAKQLGMHRRKYVSLLRSAGNKIATYLGHEYSDQFMVEKVEVNLGRSLGKNEHREVIRTLHKGMPSPKGILKIKRGV